MRIFTTKNNKPIYINDDDFQVASDVMLSWKAFMHAVDEMNKREMPDAVAQIDPVSAELVAIYRREKQWNKLASLCYDKLLKLYPQAREI